MSPPKDDGPLSALLHREAEEEPAWWNALLFSPLKTLSTLIYQHRARTLPSQAPSNPITVISISDTHNTQPPIPDGDLLIHAGDLTQSGSEAELQAALDWLDALPHRHKVLITGNHDRGLESLPGCTDVDERTAINSQKGGGLRWGSIIYPRDGAVTLRFKGGRVLKIYGSPWTPRHGNWVFQYPRTQDRWTGTVPDHVDVLVTHGPPRWHLDLDGRGDEFLLRELWRVQPLLHVFGHVHGGYGRELLVFDELTERYERIARGEGGLLDLLRMVWDFVAFMIKPGSVKGTLLVNASAVGGLRDDIQRLPIVTYI